MRRAIYLLHLYAGLAAGLFVAFIGLTGSAVVFKAEIDRLVDPAAHAVAPGGAPVSVDAVVAAAQAAYPGATADTPPSFVNLHLPHGPGRPYEVMIKDTFKEGGGPFLRMQVDPHTGAVLAAREPRDTLTGTLAALHINLLVGRSGRTAVGIGGVALLAFCLSGLVLWWPGVRRLGAGFAVTWSAGAYRLNVDLHKVLGFALAMPLFLLALTGVTLTFPGYVRPWLAPLLDAQPPPRPPRSVADGPPISAAAALQRARQAAPEAEILSLKLPGGPGDVFTVRTDAGGRSAIWIDQYSGAVVGRLDAGTRSLGSRLLHEWVEPIHTGEIAGDTGRILAFLGGLAPAILLGTGVFTWWRRHRMRRRPTMAERIRRA